MEGGTECFFILCKAAGLVLILSQLMHNYHSYYAKDNWHDYYYGYAGRVVRKASTMDRAALIPMQDQPAKDPVAVEAWPPKSFLDKLVDSQNRLVVTFVNCGYLEMADNWAAQMDRLGVTNYLLVPLDKTAEEVLFRTYPDHTIPMEPDQVYEGFSGEAVTFYSKEFAKLTGQRPRMILQFVQQGYGTFYNDADTVWTHNVWDYIDENIPTNGTTTWAYQRDGPAGICTCLLYFKPGNLGHNIKILNAWENEIESSQGKSKDDQAHFNNMMKWEAEMKEHSHQFLIEKFPHGGYNGGAIWKENAGIPMFQKEQWILHSNWILFPDKTPRIKLADAWNPSGKLTNKTFSCAGQGSATSPTPPPSKELTKTSTASPTSAPPNEAPNAIHIYRNKVKAMQGRRCHRGNKSRPQVDLSIAHSCLRKTNESIQLEYPEDADEHFNEIRLALSEFSQHDDHHMHSAAGYGGPWIENHWIHRFEGLYDNAKDDTCLSDIFGPFVPLFVPWVDIWVNEPHRSHYPQPLLDKLRSILRPNVPYITVSQNDQGLTGNNELQMHSIPNLLVLSAGGYGHVPIPLLKQLEELNNNKAAEERKSLVSYTGSLTHAPGDARSKMDKALTAHAAEHQYQYQHFYGNEWREVMADTHFSLVPRGYGRTAYHLVETLQMGLVPIYVYTDVPWIPYEDLYRELGFSTTFDELPALVEELQNMTSQEIQEREKRIVSFRYSHFMFSGVMSQIEKFLLDKGTDLRCVKLPPSVRGA